jgi:ABC-type multidrug transport system ATPase subunit
VVQDVAAAEMGKAFGLGNALNRRAKTYSGGMRRLDLAASLMTRPPHLDRAYMTRCATRTWG